MAIDRSRDVIRGLLIQSPSITAESIWDAESSYTQAGNTAGDPEPQQSTEMVLEASGTQDASSSIRVQTLRGGLPGSGPMRAGFGWRNDDSSDWRGWEVPTTAMGWEHIVWTDGTSVGVRSTETPHAVTCPDGTVLVAVQASSYITDWAYQVRVYARDSDDGSWSSTAAYSSDTDWTDGAHPCLVVLPSGRVLCYHWIEDTAANEAQVRCHYSDDSGSTWTQARSHVLDTPVSTVSSPGAGNNGFELGRLRAAYLDGQVSLVAALIANDSTPTYRATFAQYASFDEGMSFELVNDTWNTDSLGGGRHEVIVAGGQFLLLYLSVVDSLPYIRAIGHASEDYESTTATDLDTGSEIWCQLDGSAQYIVNGDLTACVDEDGAIYCYGRQPTVQEEGICVRSIDHGTTWEGMGHSPTTSGLSMWWFTQDTSTHPRDITATCQRGRVVMAHNWDASPGNEDNSLGALYLGGYSSVTLPGWKALPTDLDRVAWTWTWLPFDIPSDCQWSAAGAGTGSLASGGLNISTSSNVLAYYRNPSSTITEGLIVRAALQTVSGGSLSSDDIAIRLRLADGTDDYDISLRFDSIGLRLYDNNAGSPVGNETIDTTAGIEVLIAFSGASVATWYRARDTSEDHLWIEGPRSTTLTDDTGSPDANNLINFGHLASATAESGWYEVHYVSDEWTGHVSTLTGFSNPDDLHPRNYATSPLRVAEGVSIAAVDGPSVEGDIWHIDTAYAHAITNIFPTVEPSPRIGWRSEDDASEQTIALVLDQTLLGAEESMLGNDLLGLAVYGCNVGAFTLQGYDAGTSAWVSLAIVGTSYGMGGLHWTRRGATVIPTGTAGTSNPYLFFNEFGGGSFKPDTASKVRRIAWHSEGRFGGNATTKLSTITLDGVDGTEGASGTSGEIWAPNVACVVKLNGARYSGYRLRISAQDTVDGFFELGTVVLGPVVCFGTDYSWGRSLETESNVDLREAPDWTSSSRVLSPSRRIVEFAWVDGIDLTDAFEDDTPDFIYGSTHGSAEPVAAWTDIPLVMEGLHRLLDGAHRPVVYLPRIPKVGSTVTLTRRAEHIYGRLTSPVRIETVQGGELEDEVVRVATITLREVV